MHPVLLCCCSLWKIILKLNCNPKHTNSPKRPESATKNRNQTGCDVLPQDSDVLVPVRATLLMVETEGVEQLVLDGVMVETTLTVQRHCLAITKATDIGVTPAFTQ